MAKKKKQQDPRETIDNLPYYQALMSKDSALYIAIGQSLKPKNVLNCSPLEDNTFGVVKELQYICSKELTEEDIFSVLELVSKHTKEKLLTMTFFAVMYQWKWIIAELKNIIEKEKRFIHSEPSAKQEQAGVGDLYKFGAFAVIDQLAQGDPLKYEAIENLPYTTVFTKLYLDKERNDYQERLSKIKK